jgi:hypothetical protein
MPGADDDGGESRITVANGHGEGLDRTDNHNGIDVGSVVEAGANGTNHGPPVGLEIKANGHPPSGIDKSVLPIGVPRRIRDKKHLKAVAQQPCLVCGRSPSHAHHLTFVQPRARGLKTSDEWVVPLCYLHHRELHDRGDEREWWRDKTIDPVGVAEQLWQHKLLDTSAALSKRC